MPCFFMSSAACCTCHRQRAQLRSGGASTAEAARRSDEVGTLRGQLDTAALQGRESQSHQNNAFPKGVLPTRLPESFVRHFHLDRGDRRGVSGPRRALSCSSAIVALSASSRASAASSFSCVSFSSWGAGKAGRSSWRAAELPHSAEKIEASPEVCKTSAQHPDESTVMPFSTRPKVSSTTSEVGTSVS